MEELHMNIDDLDLNFLFEMYGPTNIPLRAVPGYTPPDPYLTPVPLKPSQIRPVDFNPNAPRPPGLGLWGPSFLYDIIDDSPYADDIRDLYPDLIDPQGGDDAPDPISG
jgi:hypothetical protein